MPFPRTRPIVASLALPLLCAAASFAQAPAAPPKGAVVPLAHPPAATVAAPLAGYQWRTLVLQHAVPSDILRMEHWGASAAHPAALPAGVRRVFALQSNNSLLLEATEEGYATVAKLIKALDVAPKQVEFSTLLVAVPATRVGLDVPDADAARFLEEVSRGEASAIPTPTVTIAHGGSGTIYFSYPRPPAGPSVRPPAARLQLVQAGLTPEQTGPATRGEFRLTPRINTDGTITLDVAFGDLPAPAPRTLRAGELTVYELTGAQAGSGERLFFFLRPTISGGGGLPIISSIPIILDTGQPVTVTP